MSTAQDTPTDKAERMQDQEGVSTSNQQLIRLLRSGHSNLRMSALHLLCEGYVSDVSVFQAICDGWDAWGTEEAFSEFPMLSYLPIPSQSIQECCERATRMVDGQKLTTSSSRCAGKLIEQLCYLPAASLAPHIDLLEETSKKSKIFFRVDVAGARNRVSLLGLPADELAQQLDGAIEQITNNAEDATAVHKALHALEALRLQHPDYMDLPAALREKAQDDGPRATSFQLILNSLTRLAQPGIEPALAPHLLDAREPIYTTVVEALVRTGSETAASALVSQFADSAIGNQRWIARGLQRMRVDGLADSIAELRAMVTEPAVWLMLLIAEVRQFEEAGADRLAWELSRLNSFSETLVDSLALYQGLFEEGGNIGSFQTALIGYVARANESLSEQLGNKKSKLQRQERKLRDRQKSQVVENYRKRK